MLKCETTFATLASAHIFYFCQKTSQNAMIVDGPYLRPGINIALPNVTLPACLRSENGRQITAKGILIQWLQMCLVSSLTWIPVPC